jgi:hypothetical protein
MKKKSEKFVVKNGYTLCSGIFVACYPVTNFSEETISPVSRIRICIILPRRWR